jgi:hypothetical protein
MHVSNAAAKFTLFMLLDFCQLTASFLTSEDVSGYLPFRCLCGLTLTLTGAGSLCSFLVACNHWRDSSIILHLITKKM